MERELAVMPEVGQKLLDGLLESADELVTTYPDQGLSIPVEERLALRKEVQSLKPVPRRLGDNPFKQFRREVGGYVVRHEFGEIGIVIFEALFGARDARLVRNVMLL